MPSDSDKPLSSAQMKVWPGAKEADGLQKDLGTEPRPPDDLGLYALVLESHRMLKALTERMTTQPTTDAKQPEVGSNSPTVWVDSEYSLRLETERQRRLGTNWVVRIRTKPLTEPDMQHVLKTGSLPEMHTDAELAQRMEGAAKTMREVITERLLAILYPGPARPSHDLEGCLSEVNARLNRNMPPLGNPPPYIIEERIADALCAIIAPDRKDPVDMAWVEAKVRRLVKFQQEHANPDGTARTDEDARTRVLLAHARLVQNEPSAAQAILESIVWGAAIPDAERLKALADGDHARSSLHGEHVALGRRLTEARDAALEEAAQRAVSGGLTTSPDAQTAAMAIRALKSKPATHFGSVAVSVDLGTKPDWTGVVPEPIHDFGWALAQMRAGKKVRRMCWKNGQNVWCDNHPTNPAMYGETGSLSRLGGYDAFATDWEVVE